MFDAGGKISRTWRIYRRAFLNGRIDLTQAEAINDMILADSNENMKLAIHGIKGSVKKLLDSFTGKYFRYYCEY